MSQFCNYLVSKRRDIRLDLEGRSKMYAIVQTGGKQYHVKPGDELSVELIQGEQDEIVALGDVLLVKKEDGQVVVGTPTVENATVKAKVLGEERGPKVISFKYKRRKNYRRKRGHRQDYTKVQIVGIEV